MRVLLTGGNGQLGREIRDLTPKHAELIVKNHVDLDITDEQAVAEAIRQHRPDVILNSAAFTNVDRAEDQSELAFAVNSHGPRVLARNAAAVGARMIHVSTDFVFGGNTCAPILPTDRPSPISVYGRSKLEGERQALTLLGNRCTVLRTAWLYSIHGRNFVKTMLGLLQTRERLGVVVDQIGTPTWAREVAATLWSFATRDDLCGIFHWTDEGVASWYDFAVAIQDEAMERGLVKHCAIIDAIPTAAYPTVARRPAYSVLDKRTSIDALGRTPSNWRRNLGRMMDEFPTS